MKLHAALAALPLALLSLGCADTPAAPTAARTGIHAQITQGSGIELNSVTGISLPLIGQVGNVTLNHAVITNVAPIENIVGQIVGIDAKGALQLTGGVLGTNVITQNFNTEAKVTNSGPGSCSVVSIDLPPINIPALLASVDIPAASVNVGASGAVGSQLCSLLGGLLGGTGL